MFHCDVTATVGRTPAVELRRLARGLPGRIVAKLEMRNPCGSVKDRLGVALIDDEDRARFEFRIADGLCGGLQGQKAYEQAQYRAQRLGRHSTDKRHSCISLVCRKVTS